MDIIRFNEAQDILGRLRFLAIQNNMKSRIVDSIDDCLNKLNDIDSENDLRSLDANVQEILSYMDTKLRDYVSDDIKVNNGQTVSKKEIRNRIISEWQSAEKEKDSFLNDFRNKCALHRTDFEKEVRDYVNRDLNPETVGNYARFEDRVIMAGQKYVSRLSDVAGEYIDRVDDSYAPAVDRISGIVGSINHDQVNLSVKEIYDKWNKHRESDKDSAKKQAALSDRGLSDIKDFVAECKIPMKEIENRNARKKKFSIWLPVFVTIFVILGAFLIKQEELVSGNPNAVSETTGESESVEGEIVKEIVKEIANQTTENIQNVRLDLILVIALKVMIVVLFLVVIAYLFWIHAKEKQYKEKGIIELGEFLRGRVDDFCNRDVLASKAESFINKVEEDQGLRYKMLFSVLFGEGFAEDTFDPADEYSMICSRWNQFIHR